MPQPPAAGTVQAASVPLPPVAPAPRSTTEAAMNAMAQEADTQASRNTVKTSAAPADAAEPSPEAEATDEPQKKSRAERAAERKAEEAARRAAKRERREAKRRQQAEEAEGGVPDDVVAAVRAASIDSSSEPRESRRSRRARRAVPDEVVEAVEAATARPRGSRVVTVGSPNGGQRIYLIPRDTMASW
jgi:hypothetical protein